MEAKPKDELHVITEHTRTQDQLEQYRGIEEAGVCPFCPEHYGTFPDQSEILHQGEHWYIKNSDFPYKYTDSHVLAVLNRHVNSFQELEGSEFAELLELFKLIAEEQDIEYGAMAMRFGEPSATGASVYHLHAHLISPDLEETSNEQVVRFRMSPKYTD